MFKIMKCFYCKRMGTFFVLLYLMTLKNAVNGAIDCPRFCECDSYQQLNRALCSSKNLISAEVNLPQQVQILDLSYNDITTVDNNCFQNFSHLKYLNLSNNALHTIDWNAFGKMRRLTEIDLSNNRLEYLYEGLFARNKYLKKINLEGNKLESLHNKPLLKNRFVTELSLKNSQINRLQPQLFAGLENLKRLDLSKNFFNNFDVEDFQHLPHLRDLNLNENFLQCSALIREKLKQLAKRGVNVIYDTCSASENYETQKFEKLIMSTQEHDKQTDLRNMPEWHLNLDFEDENQEEVNEADILAEARKSNEWFSFAPDEILCNKQNYVLCQEYRSCLRDLNNAWHDHTKYRGSSVWTASDIKFAFVMGIAIGIAIVIVILACALTMKSCFETKGKSPPDEENFELPDQPLARHTTQLPPQVRRQQRRRSARPARSLVRYEGPVAENFLSRLFGRPARHQYYRTINQNTATLIRRLSRSNLFNNRFVDRQTSSEANAGDVQDIAASAPRSETPPPSYGDIVVKDLNNAY